MIDAFGNQFDHIRENDRIREVLNPEATESTAILGKHGTILEIPPRLLEVISVLVRWDDDTESWVSPTRLIEDDEMPTHDCMNARMS